jgi:hypothetical protein
MSSTRLSTRGSSLPAGRLLRELGLVAVGLLVYFLLRGNVTDRADEAARNADRVIDWQQSLGIFWEPRLQSWAVNSALGVRFWNWIYFWGHAPVIVLVGVWLLWRHPEVYRLLRNAFLVSAAAGLICYTLFPVAPPRLTPGHGFVDTMQLYSQVSYQAQSLKPFVNPYAAMPSLHVGWAYLIGIGVALVWRDWRGALVATLLPALMALAVVLTANHYLLDGAFGVLCASAALAAALWWDRGHPLPLVRPGWSRRARTGTPEAV